MTQLASLFPAHILAAAPVPARIIDASDYLDYLLDERPDLHSAALPHARHADLADLILRRHWSNAKTTDMQALLDIADHPECDFWMSLAILLRIFPDAQAAPSVTTLARRLVTRMNSGACLLRHSDTPLISPRGLQLYARVAEDQPDLQLLPEIEDRALRHARWLSRRQANAPRYAMFNGAPIWAANMPDD
ncbi:hypothetical protein SAMN05421762_0983 [Pseudooceanicola nitratireducens]|jgi:hypothetical protein|uniref:Uncharacterized protein n=1 Tax=Pseudooceanicola nitratireducens TaxID=517719 RepID=A0A1I1JCV4_9RHOB|nr:hypothetical protein [Pseudooceanicola nitratireducens]SEJ79306.1 hypothetical protein SAMN05216183_1117 [Pseudooceanicola nitratireducens]SFC46175.1 hypothetical protein SAMN05421762_0983 [Pseudooceanicola nitratireducens]